MTQTSEHRSATALAFLAVGVGVTIGACGDGEITPPVGPQEPDTVVDSISLEPPERTIGVLGTQIGVRAAALNKDGGVLYRSPLDPGRFSWSSSAPDVASVGRDTLLHSDVHLRLVEGVGEGRTTITASSQGVTGSMTVDVWDRARLAWSVPSDAESIPAGSILAGVAIGADGTIYIGTNDPLGDRSLWHALSPQGRVRWTVELPLTDFSTPAIGDDGTLYIGSRSANGSVGRLIAVDRGGTVLWMLQDLDEILSSPAIGPDGTVYAAGGRHVYAVDPQGEVQWTYEVADDVFVYSSPGVASDGTIYVGAYDDRLHAINPDGSLRWTFEAGDLIQSSPSIGPDGTIYFGSLDGRLYAVRPDGTERWSVELDGRGISSSPSIGPDGTIYVGAGGVFAVSPEGSVLWNYAPSRWISATPILGANGTVYVGACCGITALDPQGELLWDYGTGGEILGSPAIGVDGTIIAGSFSGSSADSYEATIHAIAENGSTNGGYAESPWPTARGGRTNDGRSGG